MLIKYNNRRLYDLQEHRYVRLREIRTRLALGEGVKTRAGEDMTRRALALVILEAVSEAHGPSREALQQFVRLHCV